MLEDNIKNGPRSINDVSRGYYSNNDWSSEYPISEYTKDRQDEIANIETANEAFMAGIEENKLRAAERVRQALVVGYDTMRTLPGPTSSAMTIVDEIMKKGNTNPRTLLPYTNAEIQEMKQDKSIPKIPLNKIGKATILNKLLAVPGIITNGKNVLEDLGIIGNR